MKSLLTIASLLTLTAPAFGQIMISGNEAKMEIPGGDPRVVPNAGPDSLTILDFATFPPKVQHIIGVSNTVIGPPSNIAITPDRKLALIADSLKIDPDHPDKTIPEQRIHLLDLTANPPAVIGEVTAGKQPSGMSITRDGKLALVANRAGGTVSVLSIDGTNVREIAAVPVCLPEEQASDVAITPDGKRALVSITKAGHLLLLKIDGTNVTATKRRFSTCGGPYRCVITPDGELGLTAGAGIGGAPDMDALTIVDLADEPNRTTAFVEIGAGPESFEISPDGRLVAAVLMNGSSAPKDDPNRTEVGRLVILKRAGKTFEKVQELPIGRVPEGVAFTSDGRHLVVQCHPAKELWLFRVEGDTVTDTGERIKVPAFPSSLRASP